MDEKDLALGIEKLRLEREKEQHEIERKNNERLLALDQRLRKFGHIIGIDEQGKSTGNGLLGRFERLETQVKRLEAQIERLKPINMVKSIAATVGSASVIGALVVAIIKYVTKGG